MLEPVEERPAELVKPGEGQLHLGLDAGRSRDPAAGGVDEEVVKERCLADPRLAANHDGAAYAAPRVGDEPIKPLALGAPASQP